MNALFAIVVATVVAGPGPEDRPVDPGAAEVESDPVETVETASTTPPDVQRPTGNDVEVEPAATAEAVAPVAPEGDSTLSRTDPGQPTGPVAPTVQPAETYDPLRDSPEAIKARRLLGSGIAATVAGSALVIGSIAMATANPCPPACYEEASCVDKTGNSCFDDARNRAALTMGVPGGVLVAGGAAMIGVAVHRRNRLRAQFEAPSVSVERSGGAIVLRGRF